MSLTLNPTTGSLDVVNKKASKVKITDAGGYFTGTNVETALQEVGANLTDFTYDTEATILALTGEAGDVAIASDTEYLLVHNGTNWMRTGVKVSTRTAPDMGFHQDSSQVGYGENYIADKNITHSRIGANDNTGEGQVRTSDGSFQWHDGSVWNDIVLGFRFRENEDGGCQLEHKPVGFETWIIVHSGNSNETDPDGNPYVQQYKSSMGFYAGEILSVSGGTF